MPIAVAFSASASGAAVAAAASNAPFVRNSRRGMPASALSIAASPIENRTTLSRRQRDVDARGVARGFARFGPVKQAFLAAGGVSLALLAVAGSVAAESTAAGACPAPRASPAYTARVDRAVRSGPDLWGNRLLAAPGGLEPLRYARTSGGRPLTESGVYYLPFAQPLGVQGAGSVQLHVADGS